MLAKKIKILPLIGLILSSQARANSTTLGVVVGSAAAVAMAASFLAWLKSSKQPSVTDAIGASITPLTSAAEVEASAQAYAKSEMNSLHPEGWNMSNNAGDYSYFYESYYNQLGGAISQTSEASFQKMISPSGTYAQQIDELNGLLQQLSKIPGVKQTTVLQNVVELGVSPNDSAYTEAYLETNGGSWPESAIAPQPGFVTGSGINYSDIKASAFEGLEGQTVEVKAALLQQKLNSGSLTLEDLRTQATNLQEFIKEVGEDSAQGGEASESLEAANKVIQANGEDPVGPVETAA